MKKVSFFMFLVPLSVIAQNHSLLKRTKDKFTDEETISLLSPISFKNGPGTIVIDILRSTKYPATLCFEITDNRFGCTQNQHMLHFLFTDNTTSTGFNKDIGCRGNVILALTDAPLMNQSLADKLEQDTISRVRIYNDAGQYDFNIPYRQAAKIKAAFLEFFSTI